jgi:glycosyltransferase involved in cell wall biosynthesis
MSVELHGLGDADGSPAGLTRVVTRARGGFARRAGSASWLPWRVAGTVVCVVDPDLVPSALVASRVRRRSLVVDVHEDYLALLRDRPWSATRRAVASALVRLSTLLAARADLTVVADDHVPPMQARHRLVVRNVPDRSYLPLPGPPEQRPRAVYIGDVRRSRGLETMLEAVSGAPDWTLDIIGEVSTSDQAWLDDWMRASPASSRVRVHGRLPPITAWELAAGAWAGLVLLDDTPAFRRAVPSKLFEYLASGLAVVATPLPRVAEIVTSSNAGCLVRDATEAAQVLNAWSAEPADLHRARAAAAAWAAAQEQTRSPYDDLALELAALVRAHHPLSGLGTGTNPNPMEDQGGHTRVAERRRRRARRAR